jgi:hypothetical protein
MRPFSTGTSDSAFLFDSEVKTMTFSPGLTHSSTSITAPHAFQKFQHHNVNLSPDSVKKARGSRDYLQEQLIIVRDGNPNFPRITGQFMPFGSFARKTKIRPLDDIDMLVMLNGIDSQVNEDVWTQAVYVQITSDSSPLSPFADDDGWISSTKILGQFKGGLKQVQNYKKSEIKRTGAAVVLNLRSYAWAFDIVPALPVADWSGSTLYYLIPDGKGNWVKTDPRIDQELVTNANQNQNGYLLPLIRLIKYWNLRSRAAPRRASYYLETLLINAFGSGNPAIESKVRWSVPCAFRQLASHAISSCPDPKSLGPNLDADMTWEDKVKIHNAANKHAQYAQNAVHCEQQGYHEDSIAWWENVFPNFR